jgi:putative transposase
VGAKKVRRLMKEDNRLAVRRRKFVATTDSDHDFVVYPNLAEHVIVNDVNQLWAADITYVRLLAEFVYLAVVLDAFSRRAVGWALGRNLHTFLPLTALENAIKSRQPSPGLIHHSDRPVCQQRLREAAGKYRGRAEHESTSSSLGERAM